jgi:hypothetical protein
VDVAEDHERHFLTGPHHPDLGAEDGVAASDQAVVERVDSLAVDVVAVRRDGIAHEKLGSRSAQADSCSASLQKIK